MNQRNTATSRVKDLLRIILLLLVGGVGGFFLALGYDFFAGFLGQPPMAYYNPHLLTLLFGIPSLFLLGIFVHELGHLAGGLLVGFRFTLIMIGPLLLRRQGDRLLLSLVRGRSMAGGLASAMPADDHNLRFRYALMVAAGPLANLLVSILILLLLEAGVGWHLLLLGSNVALQAGFLLNYFALINFVFVLLNVVPYRSRGFDSDGRQFIDLIIDKERAERKCLQVAMVAHSRTGRRPREYDPVLLQRLMALRSSKTGRAAADDAVSFLLAYYYHLDRGEISQAGVCIDELLAGRVAYNAVLRTGVQLEAAYFIAYHRQDAAAARQLLEQADKRSFVEKHTLMRSEAAIALAEGRTGDAHRLAEQALIESQHTSDPGGTLAEREWLQQIATAV